MIVLTLSDLVDWNLPLFGVGFRYFWWEFQTEPVIVLLMA